MSDLIADIMKLKKERNAVILAHLYQPGEIQEIADFVGDSLDLSRKAANTNADVIMSLLLHRIRPNETYDLETSGASVLGALQDDSSFFLRP